MRVSLLLFASASLLFPAVSFAEERVCNQTPAQIAEQYKSTAVSVYQVVKDEIGFEQTYMGAGVFVDKDGLLSVMHLAYDGDDDEKKEMNVDDDKFDAIEARDISVFPYKKNAYSYWVRIGNYEYPAELVGADRYIDAALFKVDLKSAKEKVGYAKLGDSDLLKLGDPVVVIGNPSGLEYTVTAGIVSGLHRRHEVGLWYLEDFIQVDAAIKPGNSGGILINMCGEVVGLSDAYEPGGQKYGFAVPLKLVLDSLPRMKKEGRFQAGWLGARVLHENFVRRGTFSHDSKKINEISGFDRNKMLERLLTITETLSAIVTKVEDDSPAKKAGLRQGDIVVKFNGVPIGDGYDFRHEMVKTRVGQEVSIQVIRVDKHGKDRPIVFTVKLQDRAAVKESLKK